MKKMAQAALGEPCKVQNFLDDGAISAAMYVRAYNRMVAQCQSPVHVGIALHRQPDQHGNNLVSVYEMNMLPHEGGNMAINGHMIDRTVKYLLWKHGGWKISFCGPEDMGEYLRMRYNANNETSPRRFDAQFMTDEVYGRPFEVEVTRSGLPSSNEDFRELGGHWDGYRVGIDLGASDHKWAAVKGGKLIKSGELDWNPKGEKSIGYHLGEINRGIRSAAAYLPRIDTIGVSSAGILFGLDFIVASILRGVPKEDRAKVLHKIKEQYGVPLEAANDGDVTAIAGMTSVGGLDSMIGYAGGSDRAGGLILDNQVTGWFNELAFVEVDYNPNTAKVANWGGVKGVGTTDLSQQALSWMIHAVGLQGQFPMKLGCADKEILRPALLGIHDIAEDPGAEGHDKAMQIMREYGWRYGHAAALDVQRYGVRDFYLMGAVAKGLGGDTILEIGNQVLREDFPELEATLHMPKTDKERKEGQAMAAASLPVREEGVFFLDPEICLDKGPEE